VGIPKPLCNFDAGANDMFVHSLTKEAPRTPLLSPALAQAYAAASYWVFLPDSVLFLKPWRDEPALRELLAHHDANSAALISACNPFSQKISEYENQRATAKLKADIDPKRPLYIAEGADASSGKKAERSFIVIGIAYDEARHLGRKYRQYAILYIKNVGKQTIPQLVACHVADQPVLDATCI
jgi:hypothetical protein